MKTVKMLLKALCVLSIVFSSAKAVQFELLGIYSVCGDGANRSELTKQAQKIHQYIAKQASKDMNRDELYRNIDVCYDTKKVLNATLKILLDSNYVQQSVVNDLGSTNNTLIVFIVTYLRKDLLKLFLEVMSLSRITIVSLNEDSKNNVKSILNSFHLPHQSFTKGLFQNFEKFKWKDMLLLQLMRKKTRQQDLILKLFKNEIHKKMRKRKELCFKTASIFDDRIEKAFHLLNQKHYGKGKILVLIGYQESTELFYNEIMRRNYIDKSLIIYRVFFDLYDLGKTFRSKLQTSNKLKRNIHKQLFSYNKNRIAHNYLYSHSILQSEDFHGNYDLSSVLLFLQEFKRICNKVRMSNSLAGSTRIEWYNHFDNETEIVEEYYRISYSKRYRNINPQELFNGTYATNCKHKPCSSGFYEVFTMFNLTWDSNVGFHCIKCPLKFIKPNSRIHKCTECDGYFVLLEMLLIVM